MKLKKILFIFLALAAITTFAAPMKPLAPLFDSKNEADWEIGFVRCVAVLSAAAQAALENDGDSEVNQEASSIIASRATFFVDKILQLRGIKTKDAAALARTEIFDLIKVPAVAYQNQNRTSNGKKLSMVDSKLCMEIAAPAFNKPSVSAAAVSTAPDPYKYYVQLAAMRDVQEAEKFLSNLTKRGFEAKITEREQSGRPVYRVRSGPYKGREEADNAMAKFMADRYEGATLVRVQL